MTVLYRNATKNDKIVSKSDNRSSVTWLGDLMKNGKMTSSSSLLGHNSSAMSDNVSRNPPPWSVTASPQNWHFHHWENFFDHLIIQKILRTWKHIIIPTLHQRKSNLNVCYVLRSNYLQLIFCRLITAKIQINKKDRLRSERNLHTHQASCMCGTYSYILLDLSSEADLRRSGWTLMTCSPDREMDHRGAPGRPYGWGKGVAYSCLWNKWWKQILYT